MNNTKNNKNNQVLNIINSLASRITRMLARSRKINPSKIIVLQKIKNKNTVSQQTDTPEETLLREIEGVFSKYERQRMAKKIEAVMANKKRK